MAMSIDTYRDYDNSVMRVWISKEKGKAFCDCDLASADSIRSILVIGVWYLLEHFWRNVRSTYCSATLVCDFVLDDTILLS